MKAPFLQSHTVNGELSLRRALQLPPMFRPLTMQAFVCLILQLHVTTPPHLSPNDPISHNTITCFLAFNLFTNLGIHIYSHFPSINTLFPSTFSFTTANSSSLIDIAIASMCTSKVRAPQINGRAVLQVRAPQINGRAVLQPAGNRLHSPPSLKKKPLPPTIHVPSSKPSMVPNKLSPPISPKLIKPAAFGVNRSNDPNGLNSSIDKSVASRSNSTKATTLVGKKTKKPSSNVIEPLVDLSTLIVQTPGAIAAARREQASMLQAQRKMKIAHYGRTAARLQEMAASLDDASANANDAQEEKRCSFITANSDPVYIAYHDEEWGVPVHDDNMLFELLLLSAAQVGSDWTSILRKRTDLRVAFADFDVHTVANFNEKQITTIIKVYDLDSSMVRAGVDNAARILQIRKDFGSFDAYLWGFVNYEPIKTQYKSCRKIPAKTSKSETMSKDLVRRGFRQVGPIVIHSFMQAAGLTNSHLVGCQRHHGCASIAS